MTYSNKVRELVARLPNSGELASATHCATRENPVCGDRLTLYLQVERDRVTDCSFTAEGCPAALAAAAGLTEMIRGVQLQECAAIDSNALLDYLEGLPTHKRHGADLAIAVLRAALQESCSAG